MIWKMPKIFLALPVVPFERIGRDVYFRCP